MPAENPPRHRWYHAYKLEAVLLGLFAVLAIGGPLCIRYVDFLDGTKNSTGDSFLVFVGVFFLLALTSLVFIASAIVRFFRPPRTLRHILLRIAFLIAPPALLVGGLLATTPTAPAFLRGFERWVLREVDTDAVQQWLVTEGPKYVGKVVRSRDELPDSLTRFKTANIRFRDVPSGGGPCVELQWGGPPRHWGLVVGPPDMPMAGKDPPDLGSSEVEVRRPIKPGVYVFERG